MMTEEEKNNVLQFKNTCKTMATKFSNSFAKYRAKKENPELEHPLMGGPMVEKDSTI